ncbi:MAG TPA: DUF5686 family protein, partial [Bacteroidia bacterium]|nr:DUF5686 family protein [Bacteroidia bacterium]
LYYNDFSLSDTSLIISVGAGKKAGGQNNDGKLKAVSRSYIRDVIIDPPLRKAEFGSLEVEIAPDAPDKNEAFWSVYRVDSLTKRDKKTYHVLDSLGKATNLDFKIKAFSAFIDGQIPWKFICFDLNRFLDENRYEDIRAGVGLHTSRRVSEYFTAGGYGAYGFQDKQFKYGFDASMFPFKKNKDYSLSYAWSNDLVESGGVSFFQDKQLLGSESFRRYLIGVFDKQIIQKGAIRFRAFDYFLCNLYLSDEIRTATTDYRYGYAFSGGNGRVTFNRFGFTEAGFQIKFIYREKFTEFLDKRISQGSDYPVVYLNVIKGFNAPAGFSGQYDYMKYEFKVSKQFITAKAGKPSFQIMGGWVNGNLPYTKLFAGHGSFVNYTLDVPNTFETMALNEFLSDRYVALFYSHDFGRLFIRKKYFQPQVIFINRFGFGSLSNPSNHFDIDYKAMEKGYYETGFLLNNLIRRGYLGLGAGVYYRYGPYAFTDETKNLAVKFSLTFNF